MDKWIKTITVIFFFLITQVIGSAFYTLSEEIANQEIIPDSKMTEQVTASHSETDILINFLLNSDNADIPVSLAFHSGSNNDMKWALRCTILPLGHHSGYGMYKNMLRGKYNGLPACKRIDYYIYTLEKILI